MSSTTNIHFYFVITPKKIFCFQFGSFGMISKRPCVVSRRQIQSVSMISYIMSAVKYKSWYNEQSVTILVSIIRSHGNDYFQSYSVLQC